MGFSVAAAAAILFAGGLVCFSVVVESVQKATDDVREARAREEARALDLAHSEMDLINGTANGTAVELNLTNNGSVTIHVRSLDVLLNGTLYTANITLREVDGKNATNLWAPGETLHLIIAAAVAAPVTVKIVTDTGFEFSVKVS